jgi:hypothetical protein
MPKRAIAAFVTTCLALGADPGELGEGCPEVGDEHQDNDEGGPAHAVPPADKPGQSLAGGEAQAGADLLGEEQDDLAGQDDPQEVVPELDPSEGVGGDPARIVVGESGHEPRTQDRKQQPQTDRAPTRAPGESRGQARTPSSGLRRARADGHRRVSVAA